MLPLSRYFSNGALAAAWQIGPSFTVTESLEGVHFTYPGGLLPGEAESVPLTGCLYNYMRQGPVIARPSLALCRTLANTDLPVTLEDYRQPWPILGVEWPAE